MKIVRPQNPWLGHSPSPTGLAEIVGDYIPLLCVDHIGVVCFPHLSARQRDLLVGR